MESFLALLATPAYAAPVEIPLLESVKQQIINPLIQLLFVVALLYFIWGVITFIRESNSEKGRATGARHIGWGLLGLFIMISVYGLINIICKTIGACY